MVDALCGLIGAELLSDPEPVTSKRYRSVTWCSTDRVLLMDSWSNGEPPGYQRLLHYTLAVTRRTPR